MPVPIPIAYKFVATTVMLLEVNHCASQLRLPLTLPLTEQDVKVMVFHPKTIGFAGRLDTTSYSFSFAKSGRLRFITRLDSGYQAYSTTKAQGNLETTKFLPRLAGIPSAINTNEAYRIATNWLASIEVDVQALEKAHAPKTEQLLLLGKTPLPIFTVDWGTFQPPSRPRFRSSGSPPAGGLAQPRPQIMGPTVRVMIAGDTKDLLYLRQEDDSYSKRPATLIKDVDSLLAIPDAEFLTYSTLERSNLVSRFAAVDYATPKSGLAFPAQPERKEPK